MRIASVGQAVFAATMIFLGVQGLVRGDFTPVWEPVPKAMPAREALVYLCALVSLGSGIGLFLRRSAPAASRVILASLLLWFLLLRLPSLWLSPASQDSWSGAGETAVMVAGAWVLYAWFAGEGDRRLVGFATGSRGVRIATLIYATAMIPFGIAHFTYLKETASLVPAWLPAHTAFAVVTGSAFLAAGVAMILGIYARLAAALSALQMGLFAALVWVPIIAAGSRNAWFVSETIVSFALTAAAWVVADSYSGIPWLKARASPSR